MNRALLFPGELKFLRFENFKKINSPNVSTFLLVKQFMVQIKFNFNNFIFYGLCLLQLGSVPGAYAVAAGGCDWPIQ